MKRKLLAIMLALLLCQGLVCPALAVVDEIAALRVDDVTGYSGSDGVYTVIRDGLYGFYRMDGTVVSEPSYAYAEDFRDGMAVVSPAGAGLYGYADLSGWTVIAARYRRAYPFSQDRAFAVSDRDGTLVLLDREGQVLASFPEADLRLCDGLQFSEGLAVIPVRPAGAEEENGETLSGEAAEPVPVYRVIDLEGREVCTLTDAYADVRNGYHDGCIAVAAAGEWAGGSFRAEAGAWGYRNASGELVIGYRYDEAASFSEGAAAVGLRDGRDRIHYGFINTAGGEVAPVIYDGFLSCENGAGALRQNGAWGYMDPSGRMRTGFRFSGVDFFREDVAWVRSGGGRSSVVDGTGAVVFSVEGEEFLPCSGGVIPVRGENGLWGVYDKSGNLLVDFTYERVLHWDGYLWLKRGDLWRVYLTEDVLADRAAAAAAADAGTAIEPAAVGVFSDVAPDSYYARAVTWATDSDIMTGTGGGLFTPGRPCTTGEIVVCLWRAAGRPEPQCENPFADVSPSHYYYQAALWAYERGMAAGEAFGAAEPCTRSMAVTYLWIMAGRPDVPPAELFDDVPAEAIYARAVAWAVERGITEGSDSGQFGPDSICSRGQIVTFLHRYMVP